jgi:acetyl-CoA carboxylase biotin carboxyl carrier protein
MRDETEHPTLDDVTAAVRSLVEVMRSNGLTELDVTAGSVEIRLRAPKGGTIKSPARSDETTPTAVPPAISPHVHIVTAPMIGTFYASPAPGEPPFVSVGDVVQAGSTIGIIEAMKIMNEIIADRAGVVVEILAGNAQAVEFGSPLLRLDLDGDELG